VWQQALTKFQRTWASIPLHVLDCACRSPLCYALRSPCRGLEASTGLCRTLRRANRPLLSLLCLRASPRPPPPGRSLGQALGRALDRAPDRAHMLPLCCCLHTVSDQPSDKSCAFQRALDAPVDLYSTAPSSQLSDEPSTAPTPLPPSRPQSSHQSSPWKSYRPHPIASAHAVTVDCRACPLRSASRQP